MVMKLCPKIMLDADGYILDSFGEDFLDIPISISEPVRENPEDRYKAKVWKKEDKKKKTDSLF